MSATQSFFNQPGVNVPIFNPGPAMQSRAVEPLVVGNPWANMGQNIGNILPSAINLRNSMDQLKTNQALNQVGQNYLQGVNKGQYQSEVGVTPQGTSVTYPAYLKTPEAIQSGRANFKEGENPKYIDKNGPVNQGSPTQQGGQLPQNPPPAGTVIGGGVADADSSTAGLSAGLDSGSSASDATVNALKDRMADAYGTQGSPAYDAKTQDALRTKIAQQQAHLTLSGMDNSAGPPIAETNSLSPLNSPPRTHVTSQEAHDWYAENIAHGNGPNSPISAHQEFDPLTNNATQRHIITLKDGTQQPVDSRYILQNPGIGSWMQDIPTPVNPTLAKNPKAIEAAAAAPMSAAIQQQLDNPESNFQHQASAVLPNQTRTAPVLNARGQPLPGAGGSPVVQIPSLANLNAGANAAQGTGNTQAAPSQQVPMMMPMPAQQGGQGTAAPQGIAGSIPSGTPQIGPTGQAPADWASSPQATTAAINAVGSPMEAANTQQSGVQSDVAPVPRTVPVPQTTAAENSPDFWKSVTGGNAAEFGKRMSDPKYTVGQGVASAQPADGRTKSAYKDVIMADGLPHRFFLDPSVDGGKPTLNSEYFRYNVIGGRKLEDGTTDPDSSGVSEERRYMNGTTMHVENTPLKEEMSQMQKLITEQGTGPVGKTVYDMDPATLSSAYRNALQLQNQKPLPDSESEHMDNLTKVMNLADKQADLLRNMTPQDHNVYHKMINDFASKYTDMVPSFLNEPFKSLTGMDLREPNQALSDLLGNASDMNDAVQKMAYSSRFNKDLQPQLQKMSADPLDGNYGKNLERFLKNSVYPEAASIVSKAQANNWIVPADFAYRQQRTIYGDKTPGSGMMNAVPVNSPDAWKKTIAEGQFAQGTKPGDKTIYVKVNGAPKAWTEKDGTTLTQYAKDNAPKAQPVKAQ